MKKILMNIFTFIIVVSVIVIMLLALGSEEGARYVYKGNLSHKVVDIKPKEFSVQSVVWILRI